MVSSFFLPFNIFRSSDDPPNNTYESIPHSLPFDEDSPAKQEPEYAYADRETITATVTSGFNVEADMEKNQAYVASTEKAKDSSPMVTSMADNPLYGSN